MKLSGKLEENKELLKEKLNIEKSFDIIGRELIIGERKAFLVFVDGFAKDDIMLWILETLQAMKREDIAVDSVKKLLNNKIGYIEVETVEEVDQLALSVYSGAVALLLDGQEEGIIIDARQYPVRGPEEPDLERVTRGSRDGLVETIIFNTALIRRRIRDPKLVFEIKNVGKRSKSDVVIGYIEDLVDERLLEDIKEKLDEVEVDALVMAEKTLEELIVKKKWYNPLPQMKFTERPDVVAAHLLEGHIAIIVDTSPSVMLLPVTLFHFTQHAEDYYQNPSVGTYIRWIRFMAMTASFLLIPIWLLLVFNKQYLPEFLQFLGPKETGKVPLFIQFVILEFGLDTLRIASIHTPNVLSTSLGIIGALILSEVAMKVGWFIPETILYMAVAGIGTFATPSMEFAMAIRMFRLLLLILTGVFKIYGFIAGMLIIAVIVFTTKTLDRKKYTWPLIPFDAKALSHILFRKPIPQIRRESRK
ncbi:spore germination protein [Petroclostridium sp. X23]|uniref:spore germination protein n=1 Tax=Petroclostridium sp. X23 TaxID=3045146 RepID=UPI0024AD6E17|nr:spore germination protein [Petroclostridium sp. X23]WHH57633.1 spore germination protein [Petroclostridium sp. X23]